MPNGIDWEARTGLPIDKIDTDAKITVVVSILDGLREDMKPVKDTCRTVERHKDYFKGIFWTSGIIIVLIITWLVTNILGLIH